MKYGFVSLLLSLEKLELHTTFEKLGSENLRLLIDAFYDLIEKDDRINHLFTTDMSVVRDKQYRFLTQFFGGPGLYLEKYGHPRMRLRHLPHKITPHLAQVWLENMAKAVDTMPVSEELKDEIFNRFPPVAAHMINS